MRSTRSASFHWVSLLHWVSSFHSASSSLLEDGQVSLCEAAVPPLLVEDGAQAPVGNES